jgi:hypothetical protein
MGMKRDIQTPPKDYNAKTRTLRPYQFVEDLSVQGADILEEGKW